MGKATNGPHAWGNGPQPKSRMPRSHGDANKKGCAVLALALGGGILSVLGGLAYGAVEAVKAVL